MIKKFLFKLFLILSLITFLDFSIGKTLKHFYFKQVAGAEFRTTYSIDSTKADILIFGSSRANHHYVPEIFQDSLKLSFYNTGRDGNSLLYSYAIFKAILKRYNPKIVIFDVNPEEIYFTTQSYERLSSLLPYYNNHQEIRKIIEWRGPFEKYKLLSSIYPYNSIILTIAMGNLGINKTRKGDDNGYIPLFFKMHDATLSTIEKGSSMNEIDTIVINVLKSIANTCTAKNIKLFFIQSPKYAIIDQEYSSNLFQQLEEEYSIRFINFLNDTTFMKNCSYFQDVNHLNDNGARLFSSIMTNYLKDKNDKNHSISLSN